MLIVLQISLGAQTLVLCVQYSEQLIILVTNVCIVLKKILNNVITEPLNNCLYGVGDFS